MADQKTLENGKQAGRFKRVRRNVADLAHDSLTLVELQLDLLRIDLIELGGRLRTGLTAAACAMVLAWGAAPALFMAVAYLLVEWGGLSRAGAFLLTSAFGLAVAAGLLTFAWRRCRDAIGSLERSRQELNANLNWIKKALKLR